MEITKDIKTEAKQAALDWLGLIDNKNYTEAYLSTASYFRKKVTKENWLINIKTAQDSTGLTSDRKFLGMKYFSTLPDAPNGEYLVIQFQSKSSGNKVAVETITPVFEKGDGWKICGYYRK